jgi:hypothetical protein
VYCRLRDWEKLSLVVGTKKCSYIGEIHKAPNYQNASCKLTARHFCNCRKRMTARVWVLVDRLNVSDPSDELGAEGSVIFKLIGHTQSVHLDLVELL